ncbi:hypothetical protein D9M72_550970 [compost metagenome]
MESAIEALEAKLAPLKEAYDKEYMSVYLAGDFDLLGRVIEKHQAYRAAQAAFNAAEKPNAFDANCAREGSGGNYLSNASAYRNTLMRDLFNLRIPAGHIHTPVMNAYGSGSDRLITDATYENLRDSIVAQTRDLIFGVADSLAVTGAP